MLHLLSARLQSNAIPEVVLAWVMNNAKYVALLNLSHQVSCLLRPGASGNRDGDVGRRLQHLVRPTRALN